MKGLNLDAWLPTGRTPRTLLIAFRSRQMPTFHLVSPFATSEIFTAALVAIKLFYYSKLVFVS
jgi:hypothetical protein